MDKLALKDWIGVCLIFAFIGAIATLFWKQIPEQNNDLIVYMLGQLSGFVATIIGFHYVISKTDEKKADNTGKAFDAITATANATKQDVPQEVTVVNEEPIAVKDEANVDNSGRY